MANKHNIIHIAIMGKFKKTKRTAKAKGLTTQSDANKKRRPEINSKTG